MGTKNSKENLDKKELSEDEIEILLNTTEYSREQIKEFYDNYFVKVYPSGYVVKDEFKKLYSQLYPHKELDNQFIDLIFAAFDTDKSGFVTFTEFLIAVSLSSSKDPRKKLHLAFKMYDRNRSGSLEKSEIDSILNGLKETASKTNLNTDQIKADDIMNWDKDGNGFLNEEEFVNYIMSNETLKKYYLDLIRTHDC